MKVFSLFSGVGGFELGLPKEWEIIGFSEIDKYASMVLKYHYPKVKNYGNISNIQWNEVPNFDLLTGGSPCQDFSIAGKRRGLAGARSSLAWEYIRALRDKEPRYFIWENVKGVMSSRGGWDFANLVTAFSESGYSLWWQVLNAKDFGVPQNRERIFIVGFRNESPKEVFFERKSNQETVIARTLNASDWRGVNRNQQGNIIEVQNPGVGQHYRVYGENGLAPIIVASRGRNPDNPKSRKSGLKTEQMLEPNLTGNSNTLTGVEKDNYVFQPNEIYALDLYNKKAHSDRTPTLTEPHHNSLRMSVNGEVRKLMPIECERLMSWPDDWTKWGIDEKGEKVEISDSQRYKMCGNGVVSNVIKEIVKHLIISK